MKKSELLLMNKISMFSYAIIGYPKTFQIDEVSVWKVIEKIGKEVPLVQKWRVHIAFLPDEEIAALNKSYRNKDGSTDVLSFHYYDDFSRLKKSDIAGELLFSESYIISQAEEFWHRREDEFTILFIHSLLHLLGYDHEDEEDFIAMWKYESPIREYFWLNMAR